MMDTSQPETRIQPTTPGDGRSRWVVIGASVQGSGHVRLGLPCQDAHAYRFIGEDIVVAAAADGLGTAAFADQGAALAANTAAAFLEQALTASEPPDEISWPRLVRESFIYTRQQLAEEAARSQSDLRDYATTLILVILNPGGVVVGHLGDGAVVAALEDGRLALVSGPQNDEYVNVTYPLTMPDGPEQAEYIVLSEAIQSVALLTDGIQNVSIRTADNMPHPPFFEPLFRQLPGVKDGAKASQNLADFMASPAICVHTDDDKTLLLIGRRPA
jgi:hypothetical protein